MSDVCVVLDTNSIWDNWLLKGLAWRVLAAKAAAGAPRVHVRFPDVVLDEAAAKFKIEVETRMRQTRTVANFLSEGEADDELEFILARLEDMAESYRDALEDRLTDFLSGSALPYPDISHAEMTKRALARTPPFDAKGGGYRDSLVWLAALGEASALNADLVIVSNDDAFKSVGKGKGLEAGGADGGVIMDKRLVDEAAEAGVKASLAMNVKDLIAALAPPPARVGEGDSVAWQLFVAASGSLNVIGEFLDEHLLDPTVTPYLDAETVGLPADASDFDLTYVEDVDNIKLTYVDAPADGGVVCGFTATAHVELEVGIYEGTAEMLEWPITSRLGHGEVRALTDKKATAEGLLKLSADGKPTAVEDVSWSAEPDDFDYSFAEDDCVVVRRAPRRPVTVHRRS